MAERLKGISWKMCVCTVSCVEYVYVEGCVCQREHIQS